ncbi:polyketide cyclase / dehydrase and lipid transport family protein [Burkholderia thailandensis 34]|uniref:SRPBCC family protein n=1 Tax=Burkholderia thailandensis TaxID=57975 RepID=UPI0005D88223|nr:SRPBCC family protein [Burkholderia thailandensis]AJY31934.1 polyketide cyclase / dehydrase and lipid transport family protein [Burkholderia thailandensis 34]AOJ59104.1 polyketide cyclase [Burkholderia thailandensis]KXF58224.1 polyketide cyclase [Burkholderia thailandensis]PNE77015.1 polyketide cyclase [Burkholderia thailandensis]
MSQIVVSAGAVAAALALLLMLYAASRPGTFRVERRARIDASAARIFPYLADLRRFNAWNPYERKDPALRGEYGALTSGVGASDAWTSEKAGAGRFEITELAEPSRVTMRLDFVKPFDAHNVAEFTLRPDGDATVVTWAMHGPSPFPSKLIQVFFSIDKMVGADFCAGLANLKALAEGRA